MAIPQVRAGQTVWCRTATGGWWQTTAAGPATRSVGRPAWIAIPVLGWDHENPEQAINWPADDVQTTQPEENI